MKEVLVSGTFCSRFGGFGRRATGTPLVPESELPRRALATACSSPPPDAISIVAVIGASLINLDGLVSGSLGSSFFGSGGRELEGTGEE